MMGAPRGALRGTEQLTRFPLFPLRRLLCQCEAILHSANDYKDKIHRENEGRRVGRGKRIGRGLSLSPHCQHVNCPVNAMGC